MKVMSPHSHVTHASILDIGKTGSKCDRANVAGRIQCLKQVSIHRLQIEANVFQENLDSFLALAEELQLKGLMGNTRKGEEMQNSQKKMTQQSHKNVLKYEEASQPSSDEEMPSGAIGALGVIGAIGVVGAAHQSRAQRRQWCCQASTSAIQLLAAQQRLAWMARAGGVAEAGPSVEH